MIRKTAFIAAIFLIATATCCLAADHYVRSGASGNGSGSDWTNAYPSLPANLIRGDTYFIADGTYSGYTFDDAQSGSNYIFVKKAIETDHGTNTGWNNSYGDGTAVFTGTLAFSTGYYEFNGQVGTGRNGHGFRVAATGNAVKQIRSTNGADYVQILHTELTGPGEDMGDSRDDLIYSVGSSSNWRLAHVWGHDTNRTHLLTVGAQAWTIEYCIFERRHTNGSVHGEAISMNSSPSPANHHLRYNIIADIAGTGFIVLKDSVQDHIYMYGNIFYCTSSRYGVSNGTICNTGGDTNNHMYVYNNSFINMNTVAMGTGISWSAGSNNYTYNNVFYNCGRINFTNTVHDYNWFSGNDNYNEPNGLIAYSEDPFQNIAQHDYRLVASATPVDNGRILDSMYALDMAGLNRPQGASWDMGAYEFPADGSSGGGTLQIPSTPTNISIIADL